MGTAAQNLKAVATGGQVATSNPVNDFKQLLESRKLEIQNALPKHVTADRVIRLALTEFQKNAQLRECSLSSIYSGIIQASQLGLEIGVLGQGYLVPYNVKKKDKSGRETWRKEAQFIAGYKGLISLARRSGEVTSIESHIVYENDSFDLSLGIDTKIEHKPFLKGDRGQPCLVYGVAHFKDGSHHFEWMTMQDVNKVRTRSKASGSHSPWTTDFEQMVRKTLIRRMMNYLPMSIELSAALQVDEAVEQGKRAAIEGDFNVITSEDDEAAAAAPVEGQVVDGEGDAAATAQKAATGDGAGEAPPDIDGLIKEAEALAQKGSDLCLDLCRNLPEEESDRIRAIYKAKAAEAAAASTRKTAGK
ncbi:MAG: recombinase RecT [Rhodocyclaceae bacterium]|nr:recombinase RecT [Rhodocyclaceae bacterium]